MKKTLFLAAGLLIGGFSVAMAEPIVNGPRHPSTMRIWKSTNIAPNYSPVKVSNSAFIHQVLVSSPAAVDSSTDTRLTIYGSQDGTGDILARVNISTIELTTNEIQRWVYDIYASSGFSVVFTTGAISDDEDGAVQVIYTNGPPEGFKVWQSTWFASNVTTHTLAGGPVLLHKVAVTKAATGTSAMRIHNANSQTPANQIAQIDLTAGDREYDYDIMLSSGLTVNIEQNGTISGEVMFFFKKNPSRDWEYWTPNFASGTVTNRALFAGRGVFGGVINGDNVADSRLIVYDSNGTANNQIAHIIGDTVFDADDSNYEVHVTSGLTITTVGNAQYTVRYRRLR